MKQKTNKSLYLIFTLIPIFGVLVCAVFAKQSPFKVFIPYESGNDSWFYYKQIEAIVYKLYPRGYFSYNEVAPIRGGFAAWSPLIYVPYAIIGRLIGWNYYSPLIINILFVAIAFFLWSRFTDEVAFANLCLCILYCFTFPISMNTYSGMVEAYFYAMAVSFISILLSQIDNNKKYMILLVFSFLLCCARPYFILLFPVVFLAFKGKIRKALTAFMAVLSLAIYFFVQSYFCAPYFFPIIETKACVKLMSESGIGSLAAYLSDKISGAFGEVLLYLNSFFSGNNSEYIYAGVLYLLLFILLFYILTIAVIKLIKKETRVFGSLLYLLLANIVFLLAILFLYYPYAGSRHLIVIIIVDYLMICHYSEKLPLTIIVMLIVCLFLRYNIISPVYLGSYCADKEKVEQTVNSRTEAFEGLMKTEGGLSWDNTVICVFPGTPDTPFFSVPAGMGISICESYSYLSGSETKSQYIIDAADGKHDYSARYTIVYRDDECVLWRRKENTI